jgi:hypothetical protein
LQDSDLADLVQDVFTTLVRVLPEFEYDSRKSFRGWLKTILMNRYRMTVASFSNPRQSVIQPGSPSPLCPKSLPGQPIRGRTLAQSNSRAIVHADVAAQ